MSPKITLPRNKLNEVRQWCEQHISPREYWLHNQIGGLGWKISNLDSIWETNLEVDDQQLQTYIVLKFL